MDTKYEPKYTCIITDKHPMAPYVMVMDSDGNMIKHVKSYNIDTEEAEIYVTDPETGRVIVEGVGSERKAKIERKILAGSRLRFREIVEVPQFEPIVVRA